ncbi:MAG: L-threonylcarbamoyladenylate synthase, partial [Acetatifactor sp.]|nr:L-threonylcarbamoyladenylate synthase [Acetatifactor sp.]
AFWAGPLTMIFEKSERGRPETRGGLETVAVRFPAHKAAQKIIEYAGGFVAAPSANASGKPSPTLAKYVAEDLEGRIDMIVDGGQVGIGLESTIVDLTVSPPQILRPGYITEEMLGRVLGRVDTDAASLGADSGQAPRAPGMKYRHYAPLGELVIVEGEADLAADYINRQTAADHMAGEKTGVIGTREYLDRYHADVIKCVGSREDEDGIARSLYMILREFDDEGVTRIYSESFACSGFGQAIMNRLLKAAGYRVVRLSGP